MEKIARINAGAMALLIIIGLSFNEVADLLAWMASL